MKLHLPHTLLTTLMVAMSALPSFASYELSIGGETIDTSSWNGRFYWDDDPIDKFNEQLDKFKEQLGGKGSNYGVRDVVLEMQDDSDVRLRYSEKLNYKFYFWGQGNHITVGSGCTLSLMAGNVGLAEGYRREPDPRNPSGVLLDTAETKLVLDLWGSLVSEANPGKPATYRDRHAEAFRADGQTCTVTVNIHEGGIFNDLVDGCDAPPGRRSAGIYAGSTHKGTLNCHIVVEKGGFIYGRESNLGYSTGSVGGIANTRLELHGGTYLDRGPGTTAYGGSLGRIGEVGNSDDGTTHTEIVIDQGGTMSGFGTIARVFGTGEGRATELLLSVEGEGSSFEASSASISTADKRVSATQTTRIEVRDHAEFSIKGRSSIGTCTAASNTGDRKLGIVVRDATFKVEGAGFCIGTPTSPDKGEPAFVDYTLLEMHGDSILDFSGFTSDQSESGIWGTVLVGGGGIVLNETVADWTQTFRKGVFIDTDKDYKGDIDLGGLDAGLITSECTYREWNGTGFTYGEEEKRTGFHINGADTRITGLKAGSTLTLSGEDNSITVGSAGIGVGGEEGQCIIVFKDGSGTVQLAEDGKLKLTFDGHEPLKGVTDSEGNVDFYIYLTNGTLEGIDDGDILMGTGWDFKVEGIDPDGGKLHITGNVSNVWDAVEEDTGHIGHEDVGIGELEGYGKVIVDEETNVTVDKDGTIKQLEGDSELNFTGQGTVDLDNRDMPATAFSPATHGDTTFKGNITAEAGVDLRKTGDSELALEGKLDTKGSLSVDEGKLSLGDKSESSVGGDLRVGKKDAEQDVEMQVDGQLEVGGDVTVENGILTFGPSSSGTLDGNVTVEDGQLSFSGESEGSIGGNLKLGDKGNGTTGDVQVDKKLDVAGDVSVEKGTLTFGENSSGTLGGLSLSEDGNMQVGGQLDVTGDVKVEKGTLSFGEKSEGSIGGELSLSEGGNLQVDGQLTLSGGVAEGGKGSVRGSGTVTLDGEDSAFGNDVELDEHLTFKMGEHAKRADFGQNDVTLRDLSGDKDVTAHSVDMTGEGDFSGTIHGDVDVNNKGAFSGTVYGDVNLNYTEPETGDPGYVGSFTGTVHGDVDVHGRYNLSGARVHGNLDVGGTDEASTAKGDVTLDEAQQHLTVDGDVILRDGATTRIRLNFGDEAEWRESQHDSIVLETAKNIIVEKGTIIEIENLGEAVTSNMKRGDKEVILMDAKHVYTCDHHYDEATEREQLHDTESVGTEHGARAEARLDGALNWLFKKAEIVFYNGKQANEQQIMLTASGEETEQPQHDAYVAAVFEMRSVEDLDAVTKTPNATAAGRLLWHYTENKSMAEMDPAVNDLIEYLGDMLATNPDKVRRAMTALAGSTLTSLSAAQYAEHRWQMGRVRDHALMAGNLRCAEYNPDASRVGACRTTQVWAEGTSFYSEQHSRGDESGYRLNSWGGAVGMDVQMRSNWSVGLALAANYGDLEAYTIDRAKGDFDSYYMSAWSQAKNGRWGNTLVATFGVSEASLKRTFETCAAKSTSSGSSLGAMWELTYDLYPDKDNHRQILQPLFSVAVSHTSMDAFSETGIGSLGLHADKQTRDTVTLGLGARWLAAIETGKAANRTISTELRMNVAQDLGDRRSTADVALLADPTYTQTVRGARAGTTAFQIGAGINVPVTRYTQLYFNAGGDLRTHVATWNGALGVRIGF